jgi:hypothetical protein
LNWEFIYNCCTSAAQFVSSLCYTFIVLYFYQDFTMAPAGQNKKSTVEGARRSSRTGVGESSTNSSGQTPAEYDEMIRQEQRQDVTQDFTQGEDDQDDDRQDFGSQEISSRRDDGIQGGDNDEHVKSY